MSPTPGGAGRHKILRSSSPVDVRTSEALVAPGSARRISRRWTFGNGIRAACVSIVAGRLPGCSYVGRRRYFVTCATFGRVPLFASSAVASVVRHEFLRTAQEYAFAVVAYCFMPDHLHALVCGITAHSDFRLFMAAFRGRSSRVCRSACGVRVWQRGYYDRVLRDHDPSEWVAAYIVHNPVRAGLASEPRAYPFSWSENWPTNVGQFVAGRRPRLS